MGRGDGVRTRAGKDEKRETGSKPVPVERTYRVERSRPWRTCIGYMESHRYCRSLC